MYKHTQRSWVGGRLDAELMGRQDLQKYFQGASELKNFHVRRQGYISKRRGTEFVCDFENLLGHTEAENGAIKEKKIGKVRVIPLVHEKSFGYYILMTAKRAFLCSSTGVLLMDGTWANKIEDYLFGEYKEGDEGIDKRPRYVDIPYDDNELIDVDYCQSGDTVFLAHKNYPPSQIVKTEKSISFSLLQFSQQVWKRPRITNVEYKNFSGTGAPRNVSYVITYVKDGIESEPSEPFVASYKLPWPEQAIIQIYCDKGQNEEEPDHYNVYKKEFSEYGLISSAGSDAKVLITPSISSSKTIPDKGQYDYFYSSEYKAGDYINQEVYPPWKLYDVGQAGNAAKRTKFCGGMVTTGNTLTLSLGEKSGYSLTKVWFYPDVFDGAAQRLSGASIMYWRMYMYFYQAGISFHAKLTFNAISSPDTKYTVESGTVNLPLKEGTSKGFNEFPLYESRGWGVTKDYNINRDLYRGRLEFDFIESIKSKLGGLNVPFEVSKIEIVCDDFSTIYWHGIECYNAIRNESIVQDEYITPDLTITPPRVELKFNHSGDYPSCVALHNQRLCFASTTNDPFTFWMSCVGDLYNFNTHASIREDDAITATLAATEFPEINHIVVNRDLMLLAESGEWQISPVSGNTLSYKTIQSKMQSAIGCAKNLKPINVGDEIVFVKQSGETLLATRYNFTSDGYESQDLSVMSQWIFKNNPIVQMAYRQHPDSTIECVLTDGSVATLVYMKEHEVCAWSRHEFGGGWKARGVATNKSLSNGSTEIMFLVERDGKFQMWKVRDDIPIRSNNKAIDHICLDALRELGEGETAEADMAVVKIEDKTYAGYLFEAELETIRPEPQGGETIQFELKNAKTAEVRVLDSGDFTVKPITASDKYAQAASTNAKINDDGTIDLKTTDLTAQLSGDNSGDGRVVIKSKTIYPLNILSVSTNYEIQPLSGSAG